MTQHQSSAWPAQSLALGPPEASVPIPAPSQVEQEQGSAGGSTPPPRTSPDWFSLSFWLRMSCLKSIPASLLRVPFPVGNGGDGACGCGTFPPALPREHSPAQRQSFGLTWARACGPLPKGVLIGDLGEALPQLLGTLCRGQGVGSAAGAGHGGCRTVLGTSYLSRPPAVVAWLCPWVSHHTCWQC